MSIALNKWKKDFRVFLFLKINNESQLLFTIPLNFVHNSWYSRIYCYPNIIIFHFSLQFFEWRQARTKKNNSKLDKEKWKRKWISTKKKLSLTGEKKRKNTILSTLADFAFNWMILISLCAQFRWRLVFMKRRQTNRKEMDLNVQWKRIEAEKCEIFSLFHGHLIFENCRHHQWHRKKRHTNESLMHLRGSWFVFARPHARTRHQIDQANEMRLIARTLVWFAICAGRTDCLQNEREMSMRLCRDRWKHHEEPHFRSFIGRIHSFLHI